MEKSKDIFCILNIVRISYIDYILSGGDNTKDNRKKDEEHDR